MSFLSRYIKKHPTATATIQDSASRYLHGESAGSILQGYLGLGSLNPDDSTQTGPNQISFASPIPTGYLLVGAAVIVGLLIWKR